MDVRIIHHHEPGYGWSFESPDLPGLVGGEDSYEASHAAAESAARFHLACEAEENGTPLADVTIEHFVPESAVATFA